MQTYCNGSPDRFFSGPVRFFFENFLMSQKGPPSSFLKFCARMYVNKSQRGSFYFFRHHAAYFKRKNNVFLKKVFFCSQFWKKWFTSLIESYLRYSADFRCSHLVFHLLTITILIIWEFSLIWIFFMICQLHIVSQLTNGNYSPTGLGSAYNLLQTLMISHLMFRDISIGKIMLTQKLPNVPKFQLYRPYHIPFSTFSQQKKLLCRFIKVSVLL